jgi:hypothetical protein
MSNEATSAEGDVRVSTTDLVYRAIVECREVGRIATRASISKMTNLPLTIVDDRVKHLKAIEQIRLAGNVSGVFEPCEDRLEDRPVYAGIMNNGIVKVEVGDTVLDLTQREARNLGALLGGLALQFRGA